MSRNGGRPGSCLISRSYRFTNIKSVKYLLLLTDCKGESGSPKPAMVSEAICKEFGSWLGKTGGVSERMAMINIV